ncbi:hypothetical protein [Bradyrhizobium icense]|uniref:hypothetical protein n=1 Tax=Bradyrhizobium icense TaxID=1274631 RepID=UPI0012EA64C3|nr:hypothetical protein [Bradyrhizobium icense]
MTKAKRSYSLILKRDVNALWDNIGGVDQSCFRFLYDYFRTARITQDSAWRFCARTLSGVVFRR